MSTGGNGLERRFRNPLKTTVKTVLHNKKKNPGPPSGVLLCDSEKTYKTVSRTVSINMGKNQNRKTGVRRFNFIVCKFCLAFDFNCQASIFNF